MKKVLTILLIVFAYFLIPPSVSADTYDPLSVPNNKVGIHILFPEELSKAAELVNSAGGDWGYVTIPIQAGDKDLKKWQKFFDDCRKLHVIPLVRLATEGDYFTQGSWRKPEEEDVIDFANFLNSLNWPTKNRYVIVFNEVNRADEWEGQADPGAYARLLSYAVTVFKSKNQDFFIISSGMDNAAATGGGTFDQYQYFERMNSEIPGIFYQIDGFSSHSYPNPGFLQHPDTDTPQSTHSFLHETDFLALLGAPKRPVFITETGWDQEKISPENVASYFKQSFENVWSDPNIVAVTPFLLRAGPGPFEKFSFIDKDGHKTEKYKAIESMPKIKGKPITTRSLAVLGESKKPEELPIKDFKTDEDTNIKAIKQLVKWAILGI